MRDRNPEPRPYESIYGFSRMSSENTAAPQNPKADAKGALDRYFKISERGSTIAAEFRGGLATFFAMSYIVVLNPLVC